MPLCLMCKMGMPSSCQDISCDTQTGVQSIPIESIPESQEKSSGLERSSTDNYRQDESGREKEYADSDAGEEVSSLSSGTDSELSSDDNGRHNGRRNTESRFGSSRRSGRSDSHLKDQQSTGRKRAARWYPLDCTKPCEWSGRSNCGGGTKPILGCISGLQQARHHGPEKSVSNNDEGNVHRICHYCHNRWHSANDPGYDWNNPDTGSHNPTIMSISEKASAVIDEMRYLGNKQRELKKVED